MPYVLIGHGQTCALIQLRIAPQVGDEILVHPEDIVAVNNNGTLLAGAKVTLIAHDPPSYESDNYGTVPWFNIASDLTPVVPPT